MSTLLLIRHAETDMAGSFCGSSDPALNARGQEQVRALVQALATQEVCSVYASNLQRALETARSLAESHHVPCIARSGLREIHFGRWEGLRWEQVVSREPAESARWLEAYPKRNFPEGEPVEDFEQRVIEEINYLSGLRAYGTVIVTHAGVIRVALKHFAGLSDAACWACTRDYATVIPLEIARRGTAEDLPTVATARQVFA